MAPLERLEHILLMTAIIPTFQMELLVWTLFLKWFKEHWRTEILDNIVLQLTLVRMEKMMLEQGFEMVML